MNNKEYQQLLCEELDRYFSLVERELGVKKSNAGTASVESQVTNNSDEVKYFLPTIKITEDWGKIGSKDREIIEKFTRNIGGSTLAEKIANINRVIINRTATGIPQILGSMVVIEILNAVLREFTESAGGFIFEGFLAGLFGAEAVQIRDVGDQAEAGEATEAAGKPITDVVLGGREYSLKLLGQTTEVKGSFKNMVEHFRVKDHIIYLDARRTQVDGNLSGLEFGEFTVTRENFMQVFMDPFLKQVIAKSEAIENAAELKAFLAQNGSAAKEIRFAKKFPGSNAKVFTYSRKLDEIRVSGEDLVNIIKTIQKMPDEELQELAPYRVMYSQSKFEKTKAEMLFGTFTLAMAIKDASESGDTEKLLSLLEATPGYKNSLQFNFTRKQVESIVSFEEVGTLQISEEVLKSTWQAYGEILSTTIEPIYKALNEFNSNINSFFTEEQSDDGNRKQYGLAAATNAKDLKSATDNAVKQITASPDASE